jgi:hypothetical protein
MMPWAAHQRDHERLAAARAAWVAEGCPQVGTWGTSAGRIARQRYGLRLDAHLQVGHGHRSPIGTSFVERHDAHERLHGGAR